MKKLSKLLIMLIVMSSLIVMSWSLAAGVDYDISYNDSDGDVKIYDYEHEETITVSGHEDIDILEIKSSKLTLKQNLVLEMIVAGEIIKSEATSYQFMLMDSGEMVYMLMYSNGTCTGMNIQNMEPEQDMLVATGDGTDTLTVTVPLKNLGIIEDYDFIGYAMESEFSEDEYLMYSDDVPDQPDPWDDIQNGNGDDGDDWEERIIGFIEPINSSTVFKTCDVMGVSDIYEAQIELVEIQIDSTSESGWATASTSDDWSTWSYSWDTVGVSDGKHTLHARGYDGEDYYYDTITVYVDQQTATAPKTTDVSPLNIGDKYVYKMNFAETDDIEDMTVSGNMKFEVIAENTIQVNGNDYEVYVLDMSGQYEIGSGIFSMTSSMYGTRWLRKSDLAMVKEEMVAETNMPSGMNFDDSGSSSSHDIMTYDPPNDIYNFPLKVSEHWESYLARTTKSTGTYDGETESDTYTDNITMKYECLRTDMVSVPAGTFDVFLVYYAEEYEDSGYYDDDDWEDDDGEYKDSDGDGWTDDDEEYFGTDPDDPEDYPTEEDFEDEFDGEGGEEGEKVSASEESEVVYYESSGDESYDYLYQEYTIEYYSPKVHFPVKIETYDYDRKVTLSLELESYDVAKYQTDTHDTADDFTLQLGDDFEISIIGLALFIIIIVIIILAVVLAVRHSRKKRDVVIFEELEGQGAARPECGTEVEPIEPQKPR
ncbi:thrombospondin type 3 repeat-containing protein [[Eubacterium] cellulosolvens]